MEEKMKTNLLTEEQKALLSIGNIEFIQNPETKTLEKWSFLPFYFKTDDQGRTHELVHLDRLPEYVKNYLEQIREHKEG